MVYTLAESARRMEGEERFEKAREKTNRSVRGILARIHISIP
jgi:hypothetical protein